MVTYPDLQTEDFKKVNPLKKVPAFITDKGDTIFESFVIMQYLEDKYGHLGTPLTPQNPEERAFVNLLVRVHDIYIASPNNTQPNFAHTQGAMYLAPHETEHCSKERVMDDHSRAAKLAEIWKQLTWLEE
jgi:glutathione S-transferase